MPEGLFDMALFRYALSDHTEQGGPESVSGRNVSLAFHQICDLFQLVLINHSRN